MLFALLKALAGKPEDKKHRKRHRHRLIKKNANWNEKFGKWQKSMKKRNKYVY